MSCMIKHTSCKPDSDRQRAELVQLNCKNVIEKDESPSLTKNIYTLDNLILTSKCQSIPPEEYYRDLVLVSLLEFCKR